MPEGDKFLGENWLLDTKEAIGLYHDVAIPLREEVGIVDTHTHHNLRQIIENRPFPNIWRAEVLEPSEQSNMEQENSSYSMAYNSRCIL